jgi:hypothetical protein
MDNPKDDEAERQSPTAENTELQREMERLAARRDHLIARLKQKGLLDHEIEQLLSDSGEGEAGD